MGCHFLLQGVFWIQGSNLYLPRWLPDSLPLSHQCVPCWSLSHVLLFVTPWTADRQAPPSIGILQTRILEWVAMLSSRASSQPRDQTHVACGSPALEGRFFTTESLGKPTLTAPERNTALYTLLFLPISAVTKKSNRKTNNARKK